MIREVTLCDVCEGKDNLIDRKLYGLDVCRRCAEDAIYCPTCRAFLPCSGFTELLCVKTDRDPDGEVIEGYFNVAVYSHGACGTNCPVNLLDATEMAVAYHND